jgi:general L-amino acid transport system substrate-binding protein
MPALTHSARSLTLPSPRRRAGEREKRCWRGPLLLLVLLAVSPARAADIAARVRAAGTLHCSAVERPGVAALAPGGHVTGVAVDLCRAVAMAVLGPQGRIVFRLYASDRGFGAVRRGNDELSCLTGSEFASQHLAVRIVPGPIVFIERVTLMVPLDSPLNRIEDLAGKTICLMIASQAQSALEETATRLHLDFARLSFEEEDEMLDAYNVQRCQAVAGEATELAALLQSGGANRLKNRMLDQPLALLPMVPVTGTDDARWSAVLTWVMDWLLAADVPASGWRTSGAFREPLPDLRRNWQSEVKAELGGYGAIVRRNLADGLGLAPGPNAVWPRGILLPLTAP